MIYHSFELSPRRHLVAEISNEMDGDPVRSFSYSHDLLGRPVRRVDASPSGVSTNTFSYNARSEVVSSTLGGAASAYSYDPAGNRTASSSGATPSSYAANALNQYESVVATGGATNAIVHDAYGNLSRTARHTCYYEWNGQLVSVLTNRTHYGHTCASFTYDAPGRRASKSSTPYGGHSWLHRYYYSGWLLLLEEVKKGTGLPFEPVHYVWGRDLSGTLDGAGGVGGLLATEVGGVWYFPLYDANGNVTDYVSETGEVVASYSYDAFGRTLSATGPMADAFPFRFSTKYYDSETGLYYYGRRYYSPDLGRWLTRDPIEEDGGVNLYAFCGNNGVGGIDALGNQLTITTTSSTSSTQTNVNVSIAITFQLLVCPEDYEKFAGYHKTVAYEIKRRWTQTAKADGVTYTLSFVPQNNIVRLGKIGQDGVMSDNYHTFMLVKKHEGVYRGVRHTSNVDKLGGMMAEIYMEKHRNLDTYVHEFGHWLGLKDRYEQTVTKYYSIHSPRPLLQTTVDPGYSSHIMACNGTNVSAEEIKILSELTPDKYNLK